MPKVKLTNRVLLGFLVKERIKGKYLRNLNKICRNSSQSHTNMHINSLNDEKSDNVISIAFIWDPTPEGNNFWSKIDIKYRKYIQNYL